MLVLTRLLTDIDLTESFHSFSMFEPGMDKFFNLLSKSSKAMFNFTSVGPDTHESKGLWQKEFLSIPTRASG